MSSNFINTRKHVTFNIVHLQGCIPKFTAVDGVMRIEQREDSCDSQVSITELATLKEFSLPNQMLLDKADLVTLHDYLERVSLKNL